MAVADLTELVDGLTFIDSQGNRHEGVSLPRHLMQPTASLKARERHLISTGQIPDPAAPELPPLVEEVVSEVQTERAADASNAVAALRAQLADLEARLSRQPLGADDAAGIQQQLQQYLLSAANAHSLVSQVEGKGIELKQQLADIVAPLQQQADLTAEQQAEVVEVQQRVLSDLQAQAADLLQVLTQDAAAAAVERDAEAIKAAKSAAKSTAREVALAEVAKHWGSSVTIAAEDPTKTDPASWAQRWYGRNFLIPGDGAMVTSESGVRLFRFTGADWVQSAELSPRTELINQQLAVHDASTKVTTVQNVSRTGSGSGGGMEPILASSVTRGAFVEIADSSNWTYNSPTRDPHAAVCWVEVVDTTSARSGMVCCTIDIGETPGGTTLTEFALTGQLWEGAGAPDVEFDGLRLGRVRVPAGLTPDGVRLGSACSVIRLRVGANLGTGGPYALRGGVQWLMTPFESAVKTGDPAPQVEPAWRWI